MVEGRDLRAGIEAFLGLCVPGRRAVLTTHRHPDGDGIGSELALAELLERKGLEVRIVNADPTPESLEFLDPERRVEAYEPSRHDALVAGAELVVMLDNSDPQRLGALRAAVERSRGARVCIDHHPHPDPFWQVHIVRERACCTGIVVRAIYEAAGETPGPDAARALYVALVSDTGRFRFQNTSGESFRFAAELVELGVRPAEVFSATEESFSLGYTRLLGEVLASMEVRAEGRLVLLRVPLALLARHDAADEDTAEVINTSLLLHSSRLAVLFRELESGGTKVSLRSKGTLDVNALARRHGGGGHRNASGIVLDRPLADAEALLVPELETMLAGATRP